MKTYQVDKGAQRPRERMTSEERMAADRADMDRFRQSLASNREQRITILRRSFDDPSIEQRIDAGDTIASEKDLVDAKIGASAEVQDRINRSLGFRLRSPAYVPRLPPGYVREGDRYVLKCEQTPIAQAQ